MATGKLANELLNKMLQKNIRFHRQEVLTGAKVGYDTAQIAFGDEIAVLSTDPITGASANIGKIAVDVSVNDIATSGAEPIGLLLTVLAPEGSTMEEIDKIVEDASLQSERLGIELIGGHTEITKAVNKFVLSTTVIGKLSKDHRQDYSKITAGDGVYVSKSLGLEGASILIHDRYDFLKEHLTKEEIALAESFSDRLSVLPEGRCAARLPVHYMHDVTEGGLLGAIYEASQGIQKGMILQESAVPFEGVTLKICEQFDIDPLRLISSGCMLMIIQESCREEVEAAFRAQGIPVTRIGHVEGDKPYILNEKGELREIESPTTDELYRALERKRDMKIILSTDNKDKRKELQDILEKDDVEILTKSQVGFQDLEVPEDGETLRENAYKKAKALFDVTGEITLADDTGLFVDALQGAPGIYSARYAGEKVTYEDNRRKLLKELEGVPEEERTARFETAVCLIDKGGEAHYLEGVCEGRITEREMGDQGFGYDSIFLPEGKRETFAQMSEEEKNQISHRGRALAQLKGLFEALR